MTQQVSSDTLQVRYVPITNGFPILETKQLSTTLNAALQGGEPTKDFFSQLNQTAIFWQDIAAGTLSFVDGHDSAGQPIVMASSGNINMRILAEWSGRPFTPDTPIGTIFVELGNTETKVQQLLAASIMLDSQPPAGTIDEPFFNSLRPTLYAGFADLLKGIAGQLASMASTEDPSIDPQTAIVSIITTASQKTISALGSLASWGLKKVLADFNEMAFSLGVVAPLMAVPLVFEYLSHPMFLSVMVINKSNRTIDLTPLDQIHGKASVNWPASSLPVPAEVPGNASGTLTGTLLQTALSQYINSNTYGAIGLVLSSTGTAESPIRDVISVPWSGDNTIWAGASNEDAATIWDSHSGSPHQLTYHTDAQNLQIDVAISALNGTTDDRYWYGVLIVIS